MCCRIEIKVNNRSQCKNYCLFFCCCCCIFHVVSPFLMWGYDRKWLTVNCVIFLLSFKDGSTALFKAALKAHNDVVEELLKFSPSLGLLKVRHTSVLVVCSGYSLFCAKLYNTLLHCFILPVYWIRLYLTQQVHICLFFFYYVSYQNGSTALHAAVLSGNIQTVQLLLGANADPTLSDKVR